MSGQDGRIAPTGALGRGLSLGAFIIGLLVAVSSIVFSLRVLYPPPVTPPAFVGETELTRRVDILEQRSLEWLSVTELVKRNTEIIEALHLSDAAQKQKLIEAQQSEQRAKESTENAKKLRKSLQRQAQ